MTEPITVDIWSDIACPWCYIGKRRFEAGLAEFSALPDAPEVRVQFHSFELAPDTPVDFAGSEVDYLAQHKGIAPAVAQRMLNQVTGVAAEVGLDYHFDLIQHSNTVLAHQLVHFAKAHGKQAEMKERLLSAYFTEGKHLGDLDVLAQLAAEVGLDAAEARTALESNQYLAAVRADEAQAAAYGINGVPFYVVDGRLGLSGAQEPATFAAVLQEALNTRSDA